jgi:hypothetical protein
VGGEGTHLGQFGGPRGLALVADGDGCPLLAVVENDNGRIQLVHPRTGQPLRVLSMVDRAGNAVEIRGPGGCTAVTELWRRTDVEQAGCGGLLAVVDSHGAHRVLIVDVESGVVHHALTSDEPAGGESKELWFPTCVAEPRPGVLAVTDREHGRLILFDIGCSGEEEVVSTVLLEGLVSPVGCSVLPDGSLAVTDTGRGQVRIVPASAI